MKGFDPCLSLTQDCYSLRHLNHATLTIFGKPTFSWRFVFTSAPTKTSRHLPHALVRICWQKWNKGEFGNVLFTGIWISLRSSCSVISNVLVLRPCCTCLVHNTPAFCICAKPFPIVPENPGNATMCLVMDWDILSYSCINYKMGWSLKTLTIENTFWVNIATDRLESFENENLVCLVWEKQVQL